MIILKNMLENHAEIPW